MSATTASTLESLIRAMTPMRLRVLWRHEQAVSRGALAYVENPIEQLPQFWLDRGSGS